MQLYIFKEGSPKLHVRSASSFDVNFNNIRKRSENTFDFIYECARNNVDKRELSQILKCGYSENYVDNKLMPVFRNYIEMSLVSVGDIVTLRDNSVLEITHISKTGGVAYPYVFYFDDGTHIEYSDYGTFYQDKEPHSRDIISVKPKVEETNNDMNYTGWWYNDGNHEYKIVENGESYFNEVEGIWVRVLTGVRTGNISKIIFFSAKTKEMLDNQLQANIYARVKDNFMEVFGVEPQEQTEVIDTPVSSAFEDLIKSVLNCK